MRPGERIFSLTINTNLDRLRNVNYITESVKVSKGGYRNERYSLVVWL